MTPRRRTAILFLSLGRRCQSSFVATSLVSRLSAPSAIANPLFRRDRASSTATPRGDRPFSASSNSAGLPGPNDGDDDDGAATARRRRTANRTALAWIRSTLRLSSNPTLAKASELGVDGLAVVFTWTHGGRHSAAAEAVPPPPATPSQMFECAAARSLDSALRKCGSGLSVLRVAAGENDDDDDVNSAAARAVAEAAVKMRVGAVVLDVADDISSEEDVLALRGALDDLLLLERRQQQGGGGSMEIDVVPVADDVTLTDPWKDAKALGRARSGGRVLRWPVFLRQMSGRVAAAATVEAAASTSSTPSAKAALPPSLVVPNCASLPDPTAAGPWAKVLLERWGEISEAEAIRRADSASLAAAAASSSSKTASSISSSTDDGADAPPPSLRLGEGRPPSTLLSPYLRWGVLSSRRALELGVRERDLLWRDWSYVPYY